MGYSRSVKTLEDFYQYVKPLENMEPYTWICEPGAQGRTAYKIRECMALAIAFRDRYPKLAEAAAHFSIHEIRGTNKIEARRSTAPTEALILGGSNVAPQHGGTGDRSVGRAVSTSGEQTFFTIVEAWNKSQPSNTPIHFAHANLSDGDLARLYAWAKKRPIPLMIMVGEEGGITLGPIDDDVVEWEYKPTEVKQQEAELELSDEPPKQVPIPPRPTWG